MASHYLVPSACSEKTLIVRKSRFIANVNPVISLDEVKILLQAKRNEYPDARHHCWAYQIGNPNSPRYAAMNDDGEPYGTAGKPILSVIKHKKIGNVLIIVSRYFGGIKLGAGGLTRAYASATEMVMSQMKVEHHISMKKFILICEFQQEQLIRYWIKKNESKLMVVSYGQKVEIELSVPVLKLDALEEFCQANEIDLKRKSIPQG